MSVEIGATPVAGQEVGAHVCQAGPIPALSATSLKISKDIPEHSRCFVGFCTLDSVLSESRPTMTMAYTDIKMTV